MPLRLAKVSCCISSTPYTTIDKMAVACIPATSYEHQGVTDHSNTKKNHSSVVLTLFVRVWDGGGVWVGWGWGWYPWFWSPSQWASNAERFCTAWRFRVNLSVTLCGYRNVPNLDSRWWIHDLQTEDSDKYMRNIPGPRCFAITQ